MIKTITCIGQPCYVMVELDRRLMPNATFTIDKWYRATKSRPNMTTNVKQMK